MRTPTLLVLIRRYLLVTRAGLDLIAVMEKYRDRLVLLHQKDFPNDAPQRLVMFDGVINPQANINMDVFATIYPECFTEIGTGTAHSGDHQCRGRLT